MIDTKQALERFEKLIEMQRARVAAMQAQGDFVDYAALDKIIIGVCGGDGIGPVITHEAERVLRFLLADEVKAGKVEFREIDGLTIENRVAAMKAIPDDVLAELKACHVILKGPTTTPRAGDPWPNIESANVAMRKELDLFANVRPVKVPEKGIDWTFFRENTEGAYTMGSLGFEVEDGVSLDFTVTTTEGTLRIARMAYDYARKNHKNRVSIVTKANIVKLADGNFIKAVRKVGEEYPEIEIQERLVDAMAAKMMDPEFSKGIEVIVLPNLYGDIITDVAAEQQGGLGTASSSNLGDHYAMFEAIHGTAPYLMSHGRGEYADPSSLIRAVGMMLGHIGYVDRKETLEKAMDICTVQERKVVITTMPEDASTEQFTDYVIETIGKL